MIYNNELKFSSDLMQNFKALRPADTEKNMQAVCREDVRAFLSISDDGRLFVTAEQRESSAGWERTDVSAGIRYECGQDAKVVSFSVNADRDDTSLVLAAAVSDGSRQQIYISRTGSLTDPAWIRVDLPAEIQALVFYDISVSSCRGKVFITAYYKKKDGSIDRYSLVSADGEYKKWIDSPLPTDFTDITVTRLGRPSGSRVDGTYTLGMSRSSCQLMFTPAYNYYDPELAPSSSRLSLPCKADAISVLPSPKSLDSTDVFACGEGGLYWFSTENQGDMAVPVLLMRSPHFNDVRQMFSFVSGERVYIWVLNESKNLCYLFAEQEEMGNPDAWSVVAVLKEDLDYVYPFQENGINAMYGYTKKGEGILGYESAETGLWTYVTVFVSQDLGQAVPVNSYVTLIKTPQPEQEVLITAEGSCIVDINGGIYSLRGNPVRVKSTTGCDIRITELSESVNAARFTACLSSGNIGEAPVYDPGEEVVKKIFALDSADKLSGAVITSQTGQTEKLVPEGTSRQSLEAVAGAIKTLDRAHKDLNLSRSGIHARSDAPMGVCLRIQNGRIRHSSLHEEGDSFAAIRGSVRAGQMIYSSEDTLGYLRSLCSGAATQDGFFDVIIEFFDNAWNFIVKTAEKIVSFVMDCVEAVVSCAVEIFRMIQVAVSKVIDFLKYVFDMEDILRMKDVLKKIMNVAQKDMKGELVKWKGLAGEAFEEIDRYILEWGGIGDIGQVGSTSLRQLQSNTPEGQQLGDVHANHLTNMLTENHESVELALRCDTRKMNQLSDRIDELVDILSSLYEGEKEVVENLIRRLQNEFFKNEGIADMDILTVLRKLGAIVSSAVVEGVEKIAELLFDLLVYVLDLFYDMINEDIYIPCVSEFLELCGVGPFSVLDLACFLPAFMGTVIYKIVTQNTLFSSEVHDKVMGISTLSDLGSLAAMDENAVFNQDLYRGLKITSAVATFLECIFAGIDFSTERRSKVLAILSAVMAAIDGGTYVANSFFVYEPLKGRLPAVPKYILTGVKYLPFLGKALSLYYSVIKKDSTKADKWDTIFGTLYAVTSVISMGGNIYYIVAAANLEDVDSREKTTYILDTVSLIPDNLRNVADGVLRYVKPEQLPAFVIVLVVRSICGIGYGVLQIVEGEYACGDDLIQEFA